MHIKTYFNPITYSNLSGVQYNSANLQISDCRPYDHTGAWWRGTMRYSSAMLLIV